MTSPAVPYSLALQKISIVKLTNAQEQFCYNLIILLGKPGWPTRQQDEFRAEWRHGKHCDLLWPLTVRSAFLWNQWSQSITSVCKESKLSLRGRGILRRTSYAQAKLPGGVLCPRWEHCGSGRKALCYSAVSAMGWLQYPSWLFSSLLFYSALSAHLPTFFGLFIACPAVSQGGFHSYEWGWEDSWNRAAHSSDYRKLLIVSDRNTLNLSFLQEIVCKYFVICSPSLSFCYSHVQQTHLTLQKVLGGDSRGRWGTGAGKRLTDTLYKLTQATWLCKSHIPGPVLSILNVLSYLILPVALRDRVNFYAILKMDKL